LHSIQNLLTHTIPTFNRLSHNNPTYLFCTESSSKETDAYPPAIFKFPFDEIKPFEYPSVWETLLSQTLDTLYHPPHDKWMDYCKDAFDSLDQYIKEEYDGLSL